MSRDDASPLAGMNAIVVDDVAPMRTIVREILRSMRFDRVFEAENSERAIAILQAEPVDLAIIDLQLPGLDGLGLIRAMRRDQSGPIGSTPILAMSVNARKSSVLAARDAGANGFLGKPVTVATVMAKVLRVAGDTRGFVDTQGFNGPDRRRSTDPGYSGPLRRGVD